MLILGEVFVLNKIVIIIRIGINFIDKVEGENNELVIINVDIDPIEILINDIVKSVLLIGEGEIIIFIGLWLEGLIKVNFIIRIE